MAVDLDFYSSTVSALKIFSEPVKNMLFQVPVYFDDIEFIVNHKFAGELLAIDEFNRLNQHVKIDRWHGVKNGRPFPERGYLDQMYVAHDLSAIDNVAFDRPNVRLDLQVEIIANNRSLSSAGFSHLSCNFKDRPT